MSTWAAKHRTRLRSLLRDKVAAFSSSPVVLAWNGKEWKPSLDDLGVQLSVNETVADAYNVGRNSDFFGNISDQWDSTQMGWQVPLTVQLSEPQLQSYLDGIADERDQPGAIRGGCAAGRHHCPGAARQRRPHTRYL